MSATHLKDVQPIPFGPLRASPHACIVDTKPHIRAFLANKLADLGFLISECGRLAAAPDQLRQDPADLVVLALLPGKGGTSDVLRALAAQPFPGKVMLFGGRGTLALTAAQLLGDHLGLAMLDPLGTPFGDRDLCETLAEFLPITTPRRAPVDVEWALANNRLELWYQPKIDPHTFRIVGAEALVRLRHPAWGVVAPAYFIPTPQDPSFRVLSEFVAARAVADWQRFVGSHGPLEIAVKLPLAALEETSFAGRLRRHVPQVAGFPGLLVQVDSTDLADTALSADGIAAALGLAPVRLSLDDVGAETSSLDGIGELPFVELKMDEKFVGGCASSRLKRAMCGTILDLARRFSVKTVAKGVDTSDDFHAVRDMGFDSVQGDLFAKPMEAHKFARLVWGRGVGVPS